MIFKTIEPQSWSYTLPPYSDPDKDPVSVSVDVGTATFVKFSGGDLVIDDLSANNINPNQYTIDIKLDDSTEIATYSITIVIKAAPVVEDPTTPLPERDPDTSDTADPADDSDDPLAPADSTSSSESSGDSSATKGEKITDEAKLAKKDGQSQASFDWEKAFAELERREKKKKEEQGAAYVPPMPPVAAI